ncbi:Phosphatidylinositol-4-phosphate 5-Kinase [Musa troglodytarum]|uniref:1-phosphatidylinositol-3-phosphate 5-kinase n=1 Tax=Musa troglodytarum TaxID=320322 RepID=A0A9E7KSS5_9LILI|nr:Phosphatidylinositol-4-phosphate 5-Kinase [Musa troglodytarum]
MSIESDEYNVPIISCKTGNISEHHQPEHRGSCLEKYDQEVLTMNDFSPYATPPLSPMSSYASCSSSFGDIWTGLNLQGREDGCGVIDTGEKQRGKSIESSLARTCADGSGHHILTGKNLSSSSLDSNEEENKLVNHILDDVQAKNVGLDSFKVEDLVDNDSPTMLPNFETDPGIWEPPEPECMEDDQPSIADNYEDDEYSSTDWKQPSSLSILDEHQGINHSFREKRQKAMLEEMNRQFKVLVSRFLASEGISFSGLDDGQSWLGIVASLSWKAALLVKPDATEGRAMDPGSYVKVKCVASGSRHQSELIKGLVFKKHAAHKHMPTKFKNPKLLLLQGALGHSAVGLSSFDSMGQEKDYLRSLAEMIEACNPNVVLVEKNISRDIQESLTEKGITVILLKGAPSDELKKIKQVVQYTVFAAYNLILETSFVADQRLLVSDKNAVRERSANFRTRQLLSIRSDASKYSDSLEGCLSTVASKNALDVPKYNESLGIINDTAFSASQDISLNSELLHTLSDKFSSIGMHVLLSPHQPQLLLSPLSASQEKFQGANFQSPKSNHESSSFFMNNRTFDGPSIGPHALLDVSDHENPVSSDVSGEMIDEVLYFKKTGPVGDSTQAIDPDACSTVESKPQDDMESVLNSQSIVVLISKQCTIKGVICRQSHVSRIRYYGHFDVSLGRFLRDILLNQKSCSSCGKPPEAHMYTYTHQNGNLSVHVRKLPPVLHLPGEAEGKIWMWTRCLRCKDGSGISTRRVVLSSSARYLSFGKFLELSFSCQSVARLSECGHMLHRDFLRFFGIGSKVAVFVYSSVKIYAACKPPPVLDFDNPKRQEWLRTEMQILLHQGRRLFSEVSNLLQNLKPIYSGTLAKQCAEVSGSFKNLSEVEEMLIQEKAEFEAPLLKAVDHSGQMEITPHEILGLKWLYQELLFELYVWDCRLGRLLQHILVHDDEVPKLPSHEDEPPRFTGSHHAQDMHINLDIESTEASIVTSHSSYKLLDIGPVEVEQSTDLPSPSEGKQSCQVVCVPISGDLQFDHSIQIVEEPYIEKKTDVELKNDEKVAGGEMLAASLSNEHSNILDDIYAKSEGPEEMIWASFSDLKREYRRDLHSGSLHKFEFINSYSPSHLSPIYQPSSGEMDLLHYTVGPNGNIVSASKDEISSIIACGLAILEDQHGLLDMVVKESGEIHKSYSLTSVNSEICTYWSSVGYSESGISLSHGGSSLSFDESSTSISDGSLSVNQLLPSENLHPEVTVGIEKVSGKSIFTVVCIYAKKFYKLRKKYCPSELSYICSLSRCKKWDAQGGKSKAFFAKSLDDRFIIKQIKRTELDSFLKFGPDYFKHAFHSLDSGNDTCLAKIMGVYQVQQNIGGKEIKTDLMVMENLLYGHKISRTYDLKGTVFSRYIPDAKYGGKVLLDQNFVEDMDKSPIYVSGKTKHLLQRAIWNDTSFLTSINVMDYSLLVGVDDERQELVFGIIDYLRQYTWDKQLETWVKASMVVPRNELPTVISPKEYKKRCWRVRRIPLLGAAGSIIQLIRASELLNRINVEMFQPAFADGCFWLDFWIPFRAATLVAYALMEYLGTRPCTTAFGESIYCRKLDHRAMQPLEETSRIA